MIQKTLWSPDTCDCQIEYSWDDSVPESERQHNLSTVVNKCSAHSSLSDSNIFDTVLDENPRKNNALTHVLDNAPTGLFDTIDGVRQLKQNISYNFSWSGEAPDRILTISFTGINLTQNQKNTIQSVLTNRFGGKVLIA